MAEHPKHARQLSCRVHYDTAYYLKHSFTGSTSSLGTLFATGDTSFSRPSRNIAIYGHNIRSKPTVMFSPLISYKKAEFYQAHRTIHLDTLNGAISTRCSPRLICAMMISRRKKPILKPKMILRAS
ncbi:MAG: class B sortase [Oscillospiraceae bacterium]